eukprot:1139293-Pelagomonas_calceolata.AAC.2
MLGVTWGPSPLLLAWTLQEKDVLKIPVKKEQLRLTFQKNAGRQPQACLPDTLKRCMEEEINNV